jgi:tetratricopeptide (TPR) repeat protein
MNKPVEALSEAEAAQRLDPRSPSIKSATAIVYFMARRYSDATAQCDEALALDPNFLPAHKVKRWVYAAEGDLRSARAILDKEMAIGGGSVNDPGWKIIELQLADPAAGRERYLEELNHAASASSVSENDFAFAYEVALAYNALGDKDRAFRMLHRASAAGSHSINFIDVDPRLLNLHSDPRFPDLSIKGE